MPISSGWIRRTPHAPGDSTQSEPPVKNEGVYGKWKLKVDSKPKTAKSFFARLKNFILRLFRGNKDLQLQRTVTPIPATWTEPERNWLRLFGGARTHILKSYLEKFQKELSVKNRGLPDLEFQELIPAIIEHFEEDFNRRCYELRRSTPDCRQLPMSHMLYQAHNETPLRSGNNSASFIKFERIMKRRETVKAFEIWLDSFTRISKPPPPTVKAICNGLIKFDKIAVNDFLFVSDDALRDVIDINIEHFSEVSKANPSLSTPEAIYKSLKNEYVDAFCVEFEAYRKLGPTNLLPITTHIYLAHATAFEKVFRPLPGLSRSPVFPHMERLIKDKSKLPPDVKALAQAWANTPPRNRASYI